MQKRLLVSHKVRQEECNYNFNMKFASPEYKDGSHRENVREAAKQYETTMSYDGKMETRSVNIAAGIFDIQRVTMTTKERETISNLISYVAKHHVHSTLRHFNSKEDYENFIENGQVEKIYDGKDRLVVEETEFTIYHDFPHYLVAWLLNSTHKANNNSPLPSYTKEAYLKEDKKSTETLNERLYIEEVYASLIQVDEYTGKSFLFSELKEKKLKGIKLEDAVLEFVGEWLVIVRESRIKYEGSNTDEIGTLFLKYKRGIEEVIHSNEEEREKLKETYI